MESSTHARATPIAYAASARKGRTCQGGKHLNFFGIVPGDFRLTSDRPADIIAFQAKAESLLRSFPFVFPYE
jgi:hypothetical protein